MIHLATSWNEGYPWAEPFVASLRQHCNVPFTTFLVDDGRAEVPLRPNQSQGGAATPPYQIPRAPETRTNIVQHGAFLAHLAVGPNFASEPDDDVILFLDADMICQRKFTFEELDWFERLPANAVAVGINGYRGETLFEEGRHLSPTAPPESIDDLFPGWRDILAWNTGFVAARRSAYQRLYDMTRAILPIAEACFEHYAAVQWAMCYAIGKWLQHVELPQTIHLHGCWTLPKEFSWSENGEALFDGKLVAFRHAINLNPEKGPKPEKMIWTPE